MNSTSRKASLNQGNAWPFIRVGYAQIVAKLTAMNSRKDIGQLQAIPDEPVLPVI